MSRERLEAIIEQFNPEKFVRFFEEKSTAFRPALERVLALDDENFRDSQKIGEFVFESGEKLCVYAFQVVRALSERSGKKLQFEKGKEILKTPIYHAGIFIFSDEIGNFRFSLIHKQFTGTRRQFNHFKRYTYFVSREFTNKTFLQRIGHGDFSSLEKIKEAFAIGPVTDIFYKDFFVEFNKIVDAVLKENNIKDEETARNFVLLFAIRIVFLGFIQKRKWIGDDEKFIQKLYNIYQSTGARDTFYKDWLSILFFESLNKKFAPRQYLSKEINDTLMLAPYLNGGLFREKKNYDDNGWTIPDKELGDFFEFLFAHSFTIEENSIGDEDLQLNPEFLGIIFERLVNKADGAVYTPRTEVDFMCRLSLVKWLEKNLELPITKTNLYELFFQEGEEENDQKGGSFSHKETQEIIRKLESITICDPAVGSGAFLVGMMQVLDEVEQSLKGRSGISDGASFERKKRIIAQSLYGVEVKEWAVWIAQLRLWLSLFVEAPESMRLSPLPILPSLEFKVRQGDSLVQRVGSKLFPIEGHAKIQSASLKKKITELKKFKIDYFNNDSALKRAFDAPREMELKIYRDILDDEIREVESELRLVKDVKPTVTASLFGEATTPEQPNLLFDQEKSDFLEMEIRELKSQKELIQGEKPLIWNIEFADIFLDKGGFDIIIGNPPYVRQEKIADPMGRIKDNKIYKNLLAKMVKQDFPDDFPPKMKINAQSDLYMYFYIRGLKLLNPSGIHTFICSNSWLDVGYGVWLQKFLLERAPVEFIIDSSARTFAAADVNTIISVIHAPIKERKKHVDEKHVVKFIAFKKPFDEVVFTENLLTIENVNKIESNNIFRVYPIAVAALAEAGTEYENDTDKTMKFGKYTGDKWGAKYIISPDVVFNLFVSKSTKLVPLKTIYEYTQRNNLSVVDDQRKLENNGKNFPFLSSIKDVRSIRVESSNLKYGINANSEEINKMVFPDIISNRFISDRMFFLEGNKLAVSDTFFILKLKDGYDKKFICALLNSSFSLLLTEIIGRKNLGGGLLTFYGYELERMYIVNPKSFSGEMVTKLLGHYDKIKERTIKSIFDECGVNPKLDIPIEEQEPSPMEDRKELDKIIFDALDLTEEERKDIYRAVCRLVWNRISKAKSV